MNVTFQTCYASFQPLQVKSSTMSRRSRPQHQTANEHGVKHLGSYEAEAAKGQSSDKVGKCETTKFNNLHPSFKHFPLRSKVSCHYSGWMRSWVIISVSWLAWNKLTSAAFTKLLRALYTKASVQTNMWKQSKKLKNFLLFQFASKW